MEIAMRRPRSGNLTAALVAFAALELLVNRVFARLFAPGVALSAGSGAQGSRLLGDAGPLLFYLTAVLALGVFVAALAGLVRRGELYPRAIRISVAVIALFFAVFSSRALVRGQMPPRHFLFLELGFAFLSMLTVIGLVSTRAPARVKAGVALFAMPGVLHAFAVVLSSWRVEGIGLSLVAVTLATAGESALVLAGIAAPFALSPRPFAERRWPLPLAVATGLTTALVIALAIRFDLVQATVLYGLRIIDLPRLGSLSGVAHMAAFFGWCYATTELIADKGGMRLAGYGLVLLALGGYEPGSQLEISLSLLGIIALAVGELRAAPYADRSGARVPTASWRAYVGRLVTAVSDGSGPEDARPEAVWVEDGELEINRIHAHRRGHAVSIKLRRRRGTLTELDVAIGALGHGPPDASVERHRRWLARSPEHRLQLSRVKTGDSAFDQKFSVHGQAPLADEDLRRRVARQQGDGVLTLWRGTAARYLLSHPSSDSGAPAPFAGVVDGAAAVATIVDLVDTLADLVQASAPTDG
jgi:hypothetical protein